MFSSVFLSLLSYTKMSIYIIIGSLHFQILHGRPPWWMRVIPLLLMEQGEERSPGDVLGDDGKLAGVIQAGSHELDDTGMVQSAENGNLTAEHVHIGFGAVGVGSVT